MKTEDKRYILEKWTEKIEDGMNDYYYEKRYGIRDTTKNLGEEYGLTEYKLVAEFKEDYEDEAEFCLNVLNNREKLHRELGNRTEKEEK